MLAYYQFRNVHIPFFNQSQIIVIIYIMFFRASFQTEVLQKDMGMDGVTSIMMSISAKRRGRGHK